jgi:hypothetical protein
LQGCHHTQTEQIDFDDTQIFAIIFVPLNNRTSWHGRVFQWNNRIELSFADYHTTGVLAQVPWQSLHGMKNLQKSVQSRMVDREPGLAQLITSGQRVRKISIRL